jgi:TolB-like protein/tetratricopeptide (TPR) repeat protein/predicted Ser/Thr protein kinase
MIGKTISHYRIIEKLGKGGMGVVYKAEDTKLRRFVALKFLPPHALGNDEEKARLLREAQAAAALTHPSICTVHEIDEVDDNTFIAMEYIEGEGLDTKIESGPLLLDEAISIATQVAEGLAEAHGKGIIHRDIKPANIVVTAGYRVKIMDFGLARLGETTKLTRAGATMGTAAYMSPEQARGEEVDHRTDIWSLGVVLYEMIAGRRPFRGDRDQAVIYSLLNEEPEPASIARPEVPPALEQVVRRMLSKDPNVRHQHAEEVIEELTGFVGAESGTERIRRERALLSRPSVAVLPFVDMSPDRDHAYFCEGMAEEIINALGRREGLRVSSRTSSFQFKGGDHDIREIGRKLGVQTVLEGSVRKAGPRLRITVQLVSVTDGYRLWSDTFDRNMEDVFAVQEEISKAIVDRVGPELLAREKPRRRKRHTGNPEAYDHYLRGRWFWNMRTHENLMKAIECFERAIELSPDYALAYAGLSDSYNDLLDYSPCPPEDALEKTRKAALKALDLDDSLAEAHASLGQIKSEHDCDWKGAEREFKRAIALNPRYAPAHYRYGHLLSVTAGLDEALKEMRKAEALEPYSLVIKRNIGYYLSVAGRHDCAIEILKRTIEMDPDYSFTHLSLGVTYASLSMYEDALEEFDLEERIQGGFHPLVAAWRGLTYARMGRTREAERILAELTKDSPRPCPSPSGIALLCLALGRDDESYEWLERAVAQKDAHLLLQLNIFRRSEFAGGDPRFDRLLDRMGLQG